MLSFLNYQTPVGSPEKGMFVRCSGLNGTIDYALKGQRLRIGRSEHADISIAHDPLASGNHCVIHNGKITDSGSTNGTFLNGKRLESKEKVQLELGDAIVCGSSMMTVISEETRKEKLPSTPIKESESAASVSEPSPGPLPSVDEGVEGEEPEAAKDPLLVSRSHALSTPSPPSNHNPFSIVTPQATLRPKYATMEGQGRQIATLVARLERENAKFKSQNERLSKRNAELASKSQGLEYNLFYTASAASNAMQSPDSKSDKELEIAKQRLINQEIEVKELKKQLDAARAQLVEATEKDEREKKFLETIENKFEAFSNALQSPDSKSDKELEIAKQRLINQEIEVKELKLHLDDLKKQLDASRAQQVKAKDEDNRNFLGTIEKKFEAFVAESGTKASEKEREQAFYNKSTNHEREVKELKNQQDELKKQLDAARAQLVEATEKDKREKKFLETIENKFEAFVAESGSKKCRHADVDLSPLEKLLHGNSAQMSKLDERLQSVFNKVGALFGFLLLVFLVGVGTG